MSLSPLSQTTGVLYHVTPAENARSIEASGIDPKYSRGKMRAVWLVNKGNILWSVAHVSSQHHAPVDELVICACLIDWSDMKRMNRVGFYYTYEIVIVESISPAIFFIEGDK